MILLTLTYAVFLFLILRFCMTLFNFISNPKLPRASRNYHDLVSVLIPSYLSLSQLTGLLQSIREQDFENYEVLVYGDGSRELKQIVEMAAGRDARFRIIEPNRSGKAAETPGSEGTVVSPPRGAAGSPWHGSRKSDDEICSYLASQASGDYLLFLNGIERMEAGLIYNALYRMKIHSLSLLSLFADQKMKTFTEGQLVPLVNYLLASLLPLRLILLTRWKEIAAASGQFLLFNASHYQRFQWHLEPGSRVPDELSIMKKMKELGFRVEALFANGYLTGRMYAGRESFRSFQRDLISAFGGNVPFLFAFLLLFMGLLCLLPLLSMQLLGMALTLMAGMRIMSSLLGNQPVWWNLLFHPLQMGMLAAAICASLLRIVRKNN